MRPRVLHCIYDDPRNPWVGGGGGIRAFEVYRRLSDELDVTVATGNYPGARDEVIENVRYLRVGASSPYAWSRWTYTRAATRLLATADFDVGVYDYSVYTPIHLPADRPVGVIVHQVFGTTARLRWGRLLGAVVAAVERRLLRSARWVSTISAWTREQLRPLLPDGARVDVVGNGVPPDLFGVERREEDYLLYLGRFDMWGKGLDTLLEAVAVLAVARPEIELRVAGRGKDLDRVREYAAKLGIGRRVRVIHDVGPEERRRLLSGALIVVVPSRFEGFSLVAAEAMAAGAPVVATNVGGLAEVVAPPKGGVLVEPDDPNELARAIAELCDDPERRATIARTARASARRFSWENVAGGHRAFLEHVARGARDTAVPER